MPPSRLRSAPVCPAVLGHSWFFGVSRVFAERQTELLEATDALDLFTGRHLLARTPLSSLCGSWSPAGSGARGPHSSRPRGRVSPSELPSRAHAPRGAGTCLGAAAWHEALPEAPPLSSTWAPGCVTAVSPCLGPPRPAQATTFSTPANVPQGSPLAGAPSLDPGVPAPVFSGLDGSQGGPVYYRLPPQSQKGTGREFYVKVQCFTSIYSPG